MPVANVANLLTGLRLVLVPVFLLFLFAGDGHETASRITAFVIFAVAVITDRLDGALARTYGMVTEFGKLADPIADKMLIGAALIGLSDARRSALVGDHGDPGPRDRCHACCGSRCCSRGVIPASRGGKLKTLVQAIAIGLFILPLHDWPPIWHTGRLVGDVGRDRADRGHRRRLRRLGGPDSRGNEGRLSLIAHVREPTGAPRVVAPMCCDRHRGGQRDGGTAA